jgi:ribosomal protein L7/L12
MQDESEEERPLPAAAAAALSTGRMVEAIKYVREAEGLGLMEAKQRVDAYVARDPVLKAQIADQQAQMKRRFVKWALFIDVLLVIAAIWYFYGR